ncbi:ty3-gypsy retrotransposon protein [Tanacetum coccineum]
MPSPPKPLPFTKLSPEAIQLRRKEGLCFRCPEKFFPGHKCSPPQFLLIVDNDDHIPSENEPPDQQETKTAPPQFMSLSDAAYFGIPSLQTLRITGDINCSPSTVLIDCVVPTMKKQPRSIKLELPTKPATTLLRTIGGNVPKHFPAKGTVQTFHYNFKSRFQIPILRFSSTSSRCVLVSLWLGTPSSRSLLTVSIPKISFTINGNPITLTGEPMNKQVLSSSVSSMLRHGSIDSLHALLLEPSSNTTDSLTHSDPLITNLLTEFQTVFATPHTLPPSRPHDHQIPLLNDNKPVNVKPYRYPHFQKKVMTQLIDEMLRDGIIQPSQSPFSSPVLLVKKKDGTWRFCVDYRALNAVTIRDRFPIPTIDELLDELNGANIFSKIDLRSGYHQIRVKKDSHTTAFDTRMAINSFWVMPYV